MKHKRTHLSLEYLVGNRTNGANPFAIFEGLEAVSQEGLQLAILRMPYQAFLKTSYWFAVASVAKSRAGMRCQVCNSGSEISVHHRTYENHGAEHRFMIDLTVLCGNCHGLFHGHKIVEYRPPKMRGNIRLKSKQVVRDIPHSQEDVAMPDGDPIVLTQELVDRCKTQAGGFTNETLRAFGLKKPLVKGWPFRLLGVSLSRDTYRQAIEGKFKFGSGPLDYDKEKALKVAEASGRFAAQEAIL